MRDIAGIGERPEGEELADTLRACCSGFGFFPSQPVATTATMSAGDPLGGVGVGSTQLHAIALAESAWSRVVDRALAHLKRLWARDAGTVVIVSVSVP